MERWDIPEYVESLRTVSEADLPWGGLDGKRLLVTGATGMIGTFLIDVLHERRAGHGEGIEVICVGRSLGRMERRFAYRLSDGSISFVERDIAAGSGGDLPEADYFLHLASPTHPVAYATDPIGVVSSNVHGLESVLDATLRSKRGGRDPRVLLASSVEIYGENRGDVERFSEGDLGYIDCNTARACYVESKRLCEALCQAYRSQEGVDAVIARISRVYGPTLLPTDTKALSQFISRALSGEDVELKSAGTQRYSYLHVADAVAGMLTVLLSGVDGEAYNLADPASDVSLRDLAALVARAGGVGVSFAEPTPEERAGYSKATLALMDGSKLRELGWRVCYEIEPGVSEVMDILRKMKS